ncbi:hypothetical protein BJY04DRAFT_196008 [Aspergillus karnatakaensis]|uniref:uncharacterized protein n=1 Tax=Aspergillus karnatakaensis TaxID=1810916 RepID=UPI003CCCD649
MRTISNGGIASPDNSSLASDVEGLQDSVSRKRRHAMYFYRPPVWRYSSVQDGSSSPDMSEDLNKSDEELEKDGSICPISVVNNCLQAPGDAPYVPLNDSDSDHETPLLQDEVSGDQLSLPEAGYLPGTVSDPLCQTNQAFCTRLRSYMDIRLEPGERWAIHEGSLVIGLSPKYTFLGSHEKRVDEFELADGDLYVVCSLYADLWAVCASLSFNRLSQSNNRRRIAFLPLCAVTLAPNYSAFLQRSSSQRADQGGDYPGSGQPVMPPQRSHSLIASKRAVRGHDIQIQLPLPVQDAFKALTLQHTTEDFVPLNSTLEPILSTLTSRRRRILHRIRSNRSLSKNCASVKEQSPRHYNHEYNSSLASFCRKFGSKSDEWRQLRRRRSASSGSSQKVRWLPKRSEILLPVKST